MELKMIAIDLDGTLLNSHGKILPRTLAAIKTVLTRKIKVVFCTGRSLVGIQKYLRELGINNQSDQYVITFNGAVIETTAGQVLSSCLINNQYYRTLTVFGQQHQLPFNVAVPDGRLYTANYDVNRLIILQAWENSAGLLIRQPKELPSDFEIAKGLYVGEKKLISQMEPLVTATFGQQLYIVRTSDNFLEVMHPKVSKGQALKKLSNICTIKSSEIMAIGDGENDIPLFDFAGIAVAMGNGTVRAKQHADYVTADNDTDGVAAAIEKLANN
ncbi:MAG: Cof-type HAD-IIB family hydrolase [Liquorilactobacillus nagelii]|jgi:Cof subfamily protein (haloacid dehalogenase superfamily)|uniref:Hydrolase n=1 Tax=Liquorilactobacillus nagelii TaxID=82688 RepID=A0A3S6QYL3_9LACO|nr:Cof-type HAD-IIB family hydrolase [Liquorilactobacillus nagelii]AUJ31267.1 hydrolase [Liquorilactobacillus nagelii]KRL40299.1 hydrolase, had superfamily, cof family [Liquorilactobacillus nagelii DSM 13675]MCC7616170.1 Cof-type HAD-IIB family hydrolase [Liquorilactobacillus nagelii]MCI1699210.1 Cof-type HAD-IIB family hydrolase [Liquorilactobacillus nagelii]MCP9315020.1 Cof-type HAD-IIB family hydrolase [Liquorilactobacillus nagelii]